MRPPPAFSRQGIFARLLAASFVLCLLASPGQAAQILVTSLTDTVVDGDGCGLREALINANTDSRSGSTECIRGSGDDTLVLPPAKISMVTGMALDVSSDVTVLGGGGWFSIIDGKSRSRVFDVLDGGTLTVRNVQVMRGSAPDEGGGIRVRSGGVLDAEYLILTASKVSALTANARGGGLFLDDGSVATIRRSEISYNEALGAGGAGGGIYCASGCRLKTIEASTITGNKAAAMGGGLFIAGDARAVAPDSLGVSFVTVGENTAADGAGIMLAGRADFFGLISADNGDASIGSDFDCVAGEPYAIASAAHSYAEMMGACSPVPAGLVDSAYPALASVQAQVLYGTTNSPFDAPPGRTHVVREAFYSAALRPYFTVPAANARCAALVDQHGRKNAPGVDCDLGALQTPLIAVWKMSINAPVDRGPVTISVYLSGIPSVAEGGASVLEISPVQGVGEDCSPFPTKTVTFPVGVTPLQTFDLDPAEIFLLPTLNRPSRVCELKAEIVSGSYAGATGGNIRVNVSGTSAVSLGLSFPAVGETLQFGAVPVGAGAIQSLVFAPASGAGDFAINKVTFVGADASVFGIVSASTKKPVAGGPVQSVATQISASESVVPGEYLFAAPVNVATRGEGGTSLQVSCNKQSLEADRQLGSFTAEMVVTTDLGVLLYGVSCKPVHFLSFAMTGTRVLENSGVALEAVFTLDSACRFTVSGECLRVSLAELAEATASSGLDFEAFAQDVVFAAGESRVSVPIRVLGDRAVEGDEQFGVVITPPDLEFLRVGDNRSADVVIADDDELSKALRVFILDLPDVTDPGETRLFRVAVHNRGNAALAGVRVEVAVELPMWIRGFSLYGAACSISADKRKASCELPDVLAPNLNGVDASGDPLDEAALAADEADVSRWGDADWTFIPGRLITADIVRPPTIDVRGVVSVSARVGYPVAAQAAAKKSLLIDAPAFGSAAGVLVPGTHIALLALLLFRRRLRNAIGRKTDGVCLGLSP